MIAAATAPIASIRAPENRAPRPVSTVIAAPTANRVTPDSTAETTTAGSPEVNRNGRSGTKAPIANITNEDAAAAQGEPSPSRMSIPSSSRAWVSRAICGSFITSAAIEAAVPGSMPLASKIPASSRSSSSGMVAISCASLWISSSKTSRCTFIETYSPAPIENAPARSPAIPAMTTTW